MKLDLTATVAVPYGYCQCGCGDTTNLAPYTSRPKGWVKGEPLKFVKGHDRRVLKQRALRNYAVEDRGYTTPCWIWQGSLDRGYGRYGRHTWAHRMFYEEHCGVIPAGLTLDHLCRVTACVNPGHLEPVTQRVNTLRGTSPSAVNAAKTHCKKGHPFAGENLIITRAGTRACRECARANSRVQSSRRRAQR